MAKIAKSKNTSKSRPAGQTGQAAATVKFAGQKIDQRAGGEKHQ